MTPGQIKSVRVSAVNDLTKISQTVQLSCDPVTDDEISSLIVSMIVNDLSVVSGPQLGVNKPVVIFDRSIGQSRHKEVHDPIVMLYPEIIESSPPLDSMEQNFRLNSCTIKYTNRNNEIEATTFTKKHLASEVAKQVIELNKVKKGQENNG